MLCLYNAAARVESVCFREVIMKFLAISAEVYHKELNVRACRLGTSCLCSASVVCTWLLKGTGAPRFMVLEVNYKEITCKSVLVVSYSSLVLR